MLTDTQRNALFIDVHRAIELAADRSAAVLTGQAVAAEPEYPPNGGFTVQERTALAALPVRPELASAIRKLVANAAVGPGHGSSCVPALTIFESVLKRMIVTVRYSFRNEFARIRRPPCAEENSGGAGAKGQSGAPGHGPRLGRAKYLVQQPS